MTTVGLTSTQRWTHDHIARCTCCGTWEVISEAEKRMREADMLPAATSCHHLDDALTRTGAA